MALEGNISVVITCFREGKLLQEAVSSVLAQSQLPEEIIIVNDASTDEATNIICSQLELQPTITVVWRTQNGGPSIARNDGFRAAQGDILVPLDADDLLPSDAISIIQKAFNQYPDAGFIYGSYLRQDSPTTESLVLANSSTLQTMLKSRSWSLSSNWTLIGTAPLRKSLWEKIGYSDPTLDADDLHDVEFWIRAMALPCNYYNVSDVIYIWRKFLGRNSRQVTPLSWYRIAKKHFEVYQQHGLDYRAYELLLLGSKWLGQVNDAKEYRSRLLSCIQEGRFQFSSIVALLMPGWMFRRLAKLAKRHR